MRRCVGPACDTPPVCAIQCHQMEGTLKRIFPIQHAPNVLLQWIQNRDGNHGSRVRVSYQVLASTTSSGAGVGGTRRCGWGRGWSLAPAPPSCRRCELPPRGSPPASPSSGCRRQSRSSSLKSGHVFQIGGTDGTEKCCMKIVVLQCIKHCGARPGCNN